METRDGGSIAARKSARRVLSGSVMAHCASLPGSVVLSSLIINIIGVALPLAMLQIYDRILPNRATETLTLLVLGLIVAFAAEAVLKVARSRIMWWAEAQHSFSGQIDAVTRLLKARMDATNEQPHSVWLDRLDALRELSAFYGGQARLFLIDSPFVLLYLTIFALVAGILVAIPILVLASLMFLAVKHGRILRQVLQKRTIQDNHRYDFVVEALENIQTLKGIAVEPQLQRRYERLQAASSVISYEAILRSTSFMSLGNLLANLNLVAVITFGALMVIDDRISVGALACCSLLAGRTTQPILRLPAIWAEVQNAEIARQRASSLFELQPQDDSGAIPPPERAGSIDMEGVCVRYARDVKDCLSELSISVRAGEFIGITGEDGSGKTTLSRLICGEIAPRIGRVTIDGHDCGHPGTASLLRRIRYVSSDAGIVDGTVLENITMFRRGGAIARAHEAARLIGLEDDIFRLASGYETKLGAGSAESLPAGFLQRIAIARAIAARPNILILDESNTHFDRRSDLDFGRALGDLRGQITIILISNRPSLLRLADRSFELREGSLREISPPASVSPKRYSDAIA